MVIHLKACLQMNDHMCPMSSSVNYVLQIIYQMSLLKIKQLWSHLYPQVLEEASSPYNPVLKVLLTQGRFQLLSKNAIYSYADLYDNFTKTFRAMDLNTLPIKKVLILGYGLGSIPEILEKLFRKKYHYTAVEIDSEVIRLAKKYTIPTLKSKIDLICSDAYLYIQEATPQTQSFDLICIDLFIDESVPKPFLHIKFLESVARLLTKEGVLLFNLLAHTEDARKFGNLYYDLVFQSVFPHSYCFDTDTNYILVSRADVFNLKT
jgi:spermidine synthase